MLEIENKVNELQGVQSDVLPAEILTSTDPLLLKGLVSDWPFVQAGLESATAAAKYLLRFYADAMVGVGYVPPEYSTSTRIFDATVTSLRAGLTCTG